MHRLQDMSRYALNCSILFTELSRWLRDLGSEGYDGFQPSVRSVDSFGWVSAA